MNMKRFTVKPCGSPNTEIYYKVFDNMHDRFRLSPEATSIYFNTAERAEQVAELLNKEWSDFLRS